MFQNLNEETIDNNEYKENVKAKNKSDIFNNVFALSNIPIYIISFMLSMVGIAGDVSPFSISLLGACISNAIPLLGIVVFSIIGNVIKFGVGRIIRLHFNNTCNVSNILYYKAKIQ